MYDIILIEEKHLVIAVLVVAVIILSNKCYRNEDKVMACQRLLQRVFLDKLYYES